jgi:mannose-6-phosphate isomerase-like protein (cupin superfamily)
MEKPKVIIREADIEGQLKTPYPRVSKILISEHTVGATKISMGTNVTEPGSRIPLHKHTDSEEAMFVIEGTGKLIVGEDEYDLYPGTAIFSPLGVDHTIVNTGDTQFKIVWAYGPPLEAHLKSEDK